MKKDFSIIIPHKNIPKLLQRSLDSIPQRDDLEVIVVDDNSDPTIVDFNNFPGKDRPDTTVIFDKSGKGAGRARNIGLEHAKGKWLLFLDADDFFNYCIRDILDDYKDSEADIIFFDSNSINSDTYQRGNRGAYTHTMIDLYDKDKEQGEFQLRYYLGVPWSKIVRHSIVKDNKILFDETPINNDTTFSYKIGLAAKTIAVDKRAGYCVTIRNGSISTTMTDEKTLASIEVFTRKYRFLLDHGIDGLEGFVTEQMKELKRRGKKELYEKGLAILAKYGFDESLLEKPYTMPPLFEADQDQEDFLCTEFGLCMYAFYKKKSWKYKLLLSILHLKALIKK